MLEAEMASITGNIFISKLLNVKNYKGFKEKQVSCMLITSDNTCVTTTENINFLLVTTKGEVIH